MGEALLIIWGIATFGSVLGTALAYYRFKIRIYPEPWRREPITILKPLKGMNPEIRRALQTFFQIHYLKGDELILCIESTKDPAFWEAFRFVQNYPDIPARIVCRPVTLCMNPKVNNIYEAFCDARNDRILISDDNAIAESDYLERLDMEFTGGVLTAVILADDPQTFGGALEQMILSTFYARGLMLSHAARHPCVMGKSMMVNRNQITGGRLINVGRYMAEDYATGKTAKRLGFPVRLLSRPVHQTLNHYTIRDFWNRHLRWGRLRLFAAPLAFMFEPLVYSTVGAGICGAIGAHLTHPHWIWRFCAAHLVIWFTSDIALMRILGQPVGSISTPIVWLALQLSHLPMWLHMASSDRCGWKDNKFKIGFGGTIYKE